MGRAPGSRLRPDIRWFREGGGMKPDTQVVGPLKDTPADVVPLPGLPSEQVRQFIRASKAENTLRGYTADWRDFCGWSEAHSISPLPATPEAVAAYIAECASHLRSEERRVGKERRSRR